MTYAYTYARTVYIRAREYIRARVSIRHSARKASIEKERKRETERKRDHIYLLNERHRNDVRKANSFKIIAVAAASVSSRLLSRHITSCARVAQIHLYRWAYRVYRKDLRPMM